MFSIAVEGLTSRSCPSRFRRVMSTLTDPGRGSCCDPTETCCHRGHLEPAARILTCGSSVGSHRPVGESQNTTNDAGQYLAITLHHQVVPGVCR